MRAGQLLICLLLISAGAFGATRVDLDADWRFRAETPGAASGSITPAAIPPDTELVSLPHTWNRPGPTYDHLGYGWYFREFDLPKLPADATVLLHFGATFYKATVWVNGVEAGAHEGGYSAWSVDITKQLRERNLVAVRVDNRVDTIAIPGYGARGDPKAWYDWWDYGGITRDAWLTIHGPVRLDSQFIRTAVTEVGLKAHDRVRFSSTLTKAAKLRLRGLLRSPQGAVVDSQTLELDSKPGVNEALLAFDIVPKAQFWDLEHPNLYRIEIELLDAGGRLLDTHADNFGIRTIDIANRHLLVNGKRVRLTGMTRHAESPWEGAAETRGTMLHDWQDMRSLNMHLTRPVHYAPDPQVLDFADRHGILLIPEIPVWQASEAQLSNPKYQELARQQLREMIEQIGNHPSVFAWSVANESATGSPGGIAYFRAMRDFIRSIDPTRPVTFADDNLPKLKSADESAAKDADFLMMNEYFGAWHGPREALGPALDKVGAMFPDKMVIISEMGFPGIFAKNAAEAEVQRVSIFREQLPEIAKRDFVAGAIMWCYQDYSSRRYYWPGQEDAVFDHGIVDANRQRKTSYFAWKELNEPARIEARWTGKDGAPTDFAISITPNNPAQLPYLPLAGYRASWQLVDAENHEFGRGDVPLAGEKPASSSGRVSTQPEKKPFRLRVLVQRPDGSVAASRELVSP